jgi:hypothetical protein
MVHVVKGRQYSAMHFIYISQFLQTLGGGACWQTTPSNNLPEVEVLLWQI